MKNRYIFWLRLLAEAAANAHNQNNSTGAKATTQDHRASANAQLQGQRQRSTHQQKTRPDRRGSCSPNKTRQIQGPHGSPRVAQVQATPAAQNKGPGASANAQLPTTPRASANAQLHITKADLGASRQSPGGAGAGHPRPADRDTTTDKHPHNTMTSGGAVHPARHRPLRVQGSTSGGAALLGAIPRPDTRQTTWPLQHYDGGGAVHPARNRALACAGVDFRRGSSSRGDPSPRY